MCWRERMMFLRIFLLIFSFVFVVSSSSWADDFKDAMSAYRAKNYITAFRILTPLAEQGNAGAQYFLGLMYHQGQGVPRSTRVAIKWYTAAAEQGHADAQNHLGLIYDNAQGVPRNYGAAIRWYTAAAEQGHANAQNNLGLIYTKGKGNPQDYVKAYAWYTVAGESGSKEGQENRSTLLNEMTPEQFEKGQELAKKLRAELDN